MASWNGWNVRAAKVELLCAVYHIIITETAALLPGESEGVTTHHTVASAESKEFLTHTRISDTLSHPSSSHCCDLSPSVWLSCHRHD